MSVFWPTGSNASRSRTTRSACRRPLPGGTTCSGRSVNSSAPDAVVVPNGRHRQHRAELAGELALESRHRAESLGPREIDGEHHRELTLLDIALDEGAAHARGDVPVDRAHLVARLVFADLGELHPLPLEYRAVLAGEERVHEPAGSNLEQLDLPQDFRRNGAGGPRCSNAGLRLGGRRVGSRRAARRSRRVVLLPGSRSALGHGLSMAPRILFTMMSLVTSSASAS